MDQTIRELLYIEAVEMTYQLFRDPLDVHVDAIFEQLLTKYRLAMDREGATVPQE